MGTWGKVPQNLRWGTAHASVPPIFLEVVFVGCARKYEQSKKGVIKELFFEISVFLVKKGSYNDITHSTVKIGTI